MKNKVNFATVSSPMLDSLRMWFSPSCSILMCRNIVKTRNYYTEMFGIPTKPRDYMSAPYQMSKVNSTLHQLVRDWSDEVVS